MPVGSTTSKAETRSEATSSKLSPRSNMSRTLPLLIGLIPGSSIRRTGFSILCIFVHPPPPPPPPPEGGGVIFFSFFFSPPPGGGRGGGGGNFHAPYIYSFLADMASIRIVATSGL